MHCAVVIGLVTACTLPVSHGGPGSSTRDRGPSPIDGSLDASGGKGRGEGE
jgi:hypothetical protein